MNEQPAHPTMLASRLARTERRLAECEFDRDAAIVSRDSALSAYDHNAAVLAEVTSERDWLRERLRELAEELDVTLTRRGEAAAIRLAILQLRRIVTESEGTDT